MSRWKVHKVGDMWEATDPLGEYTQAFLWWHVAMAYADEMARTVEVTLPRRTTFPTPRHHLNRTGLVMEWEQSTRFPNLPPKYLTVHPDELQPLALALLAQHYRKEHA